MKHVRLLFLLTSVLAWTGCDSGSDPDLFGASLFDGMGTLVLEGDLRLDIEAGGPEDGTREVTGTWRLGPPGGSSASGPLQGTVLGTEMDVVLDEPNQSDSGFNLRGTYDGDRFAGTWSRITIAGPQPQGPFEAVRQ